MKLTIIGGGLSGLISAILLARKNWDVTLIEKKEYPFHRVCGEYISNEVIPFLEKHGLYPTELGPASLTDFQLSDTSGNTLDMKLDLGGFGISRYTFDQWLAKKAVAVGVNLLTGTQVNDVAFSGNKFHVLSTKGEMLCDYVLGTFGKRSNLDRSLNRPFFKKRSPFIGVKYHLKNEKLSDKLIALHNFEGGYCGVSRVENGIFNLCYLSQRSNLKKSDSIESMEKTVLYQNPHLKDIFQQSTFLFDQPKVINEVSFSPKEPVYNHILMTGDAAGMITPLCGNGMAMAIHGAKLLVEHMENHRKKNSSREELESSYSHIWKKTFQKRHWAGRQIQKSLFGAPFSSRLAVSLGRTSKSAANWLMSKTHGQPFS
ncbi:MAG: NAD(P)/FAD-dependent oxidoreductase [Cyclobacteriaceae bacterium]